MKTAEHRTIELLSLIEPILNFQIDPTNFMPMIVSIEERIKDILTEHDKEIKDLIDGTMMEQIEDENKVEQTFRNIYNLALKDLRNKL